MRPNEIPKASFFERVGPAIRARRRKAGYGAREIALRLGVSRSLVLKQEGGKYELTLGTIEKYAKILGTTTAQIVADAEDRSAVVNEPIDVPSYEEGQLLSAYNRLPEEIRTDLVGVIQGLADASTNGLRMPADDQSELISSLRTFRDHRDKNTLGHLIGVLDRVLP